MLNDGTIIPDGECGYSEGRLWCWFAGTMEQAASLFFDPSKTSRITFDYGEMSETWDGFTDCTNLSIDNDGEVSVCLTKGG